MWFGQHRINLHLLFQLTYTFLSNRIINQSYSFFNQTDDKNILNSSEKQRKSLTPYSYLPFLTISISNTDLLSFSRRALLLCTVLYCTCYLGLTQEHPEGKTQPPFSSPFISHMPFQVE